MIHRTDACGDGGFFGRNEGPVRFVGRARGDPALEGVDVFRRDGGEVSLRRRHDDLRIVGQDVLDDPALVGVTWDDGGGSIALGDGVLADVEAQLPSPVFRVLTVTEETVFREDGADVAVETRLCGVGEGTRQCDGQCRQDELEPQGRHARIPLITLAGFTPVSFWLSPWNGNESL